MNLSLLLAFGHLVLLPALWKLRGWPERKLVLSDGRCELFAKQSGRREADGDCSERSSISHRRTSNSTDEIPSIS